MKKNFYFQHSLMSMFDPRMKHLVDNEGLRGLGAYWIIIEKLSILPEPRAQLDYLRAYCDSKKITLCYLKKIILEYDLFELDEDGYFMPKELNPLHKKGEKTEKTTQEKPDSKAKNDEKQQKVSRNKSKKQSDLSHKSDGRIFTTICTGIDQSRFFQIFTKSLIDKLILPKTTANYNSKYNTKYYFR